MSTPLQIWFSAFRLRTLLLAIASIALGSFLAAAQGGFHWRVALLSLLTAVLLQILSNLANDYGDTEHGADSDERIGPVRVSQQGQVSTRVMRRVILLFVLLCLAAGYLLVRGESWFFYGLGLAAIVAAIAYTAGPKPYGYAGMGDLFVFLFFGLTGVGGTYFLHTHRMSPAILLPAAACGFFCVAVLNINNMRDLTSDRAAGKITIPVRLGVARARIYHWLLLTAGLISAVAYISLNYSSPWQFLFLLVAPFLVWNGISISTQTSAANLDPYLRQMAVATLLFSLVFGAGILM